MDHLTSNLQFFAAGAAVLAAFFSFSVWARNRKEGAYVTFGFWCLGLAAYWIFLRTTLKTPDLDERAVYVRLGAGAYIVSQFFYALFLHSFSPRAHRFVPIASALVGALLLTVNLVQPYGVLNQVVHSTSPVDYFWGERIWLGNAERSAWAYGLLVWAVALRIYALALAHLIAKGGNPRQGITLCIFGLVDLAGLAINAMIILLGYRLLFVQSWSSFIGMWIMAQYFATQLQSRTRDLEQAHTVLVESESRFRTIAENSMVGIFILQNDVFTFVNESGARIFEMTPQEMTALPVGGFLDLVYAEERAFVAEQSARKQRGQPDVVKRYEFRGITATGQVRWLEVHSNSILYDQGFANLVLMLDITERKNAQAELQAHRMHLEELVAQRTQELAEAQADLLQKERLATLGLLTGIVAHELRNPLGAIRTTASTIQMTAQEAYPELEKAFQRIDRSIDRCERIIQELLNYTRPPIEQVQDTRMDELVLSALGDVARPSAAIRLEPDLQAGCILEVDRERIRRVILNVVDNAVQAIAGQPGRTGGRITLESRVEDGRYRIRIADDGPGIPPEVMGRIFEPLFSTKGFGVGLGLTIVKQIMEAHGGGVEMESQVGCGAQVTLWLPLAAPPAAA